MTRHLVRKGDTLTDPRAIAKWLAARQRLLASPSAALPVPTPRIEGLRPAPRVRTSRGGLTAASG